MFANTRFAYLQELVTHMDFIYFVLITVPRSIKLEWVPKLNISQLYELEKFNSLTTELCDVSKIISVIHIPIVISQFHYTHGITEC